MNHIIILMTMQGDFIRSKRDGSGKIGYMAQLCQGNLILQHGEGLHGFAQDVEMGQGKR